MLQFTYADDDLQIAYSETRNALAEYTRGQSRWLFLGWLHEGHIHSLAQAREATTQWLETIGKATS